MKEPHACVMCRSRKCYDSHNKDLDICEYGIAYYNDNGAILRKEPLMPLRHISHNLRHALNHIINLIVEQANQLDPNLSAKKININTSTGRIFAAAIIIDHFIQMIANVHEFHPPELQGISHAKERKLHDIVKQYFDIFSIIKSAQRPHYLTLNIDNVNETIIAFYVPCVEYLFSILMDNVWKYSIDGTEVEVETIKTTEGIVNVTVKNMSRPLPDAFDPFSKGTQFNKRSEGFGYGLYWASVLIDHYNAVSGVEHDHLRIVHRQTLMGQDEALQQFTLQNLIVKPHVE
jgi:K+-sensing histidine kinase KdpD